MNSEALVRDLLLSHAEPPQSAEAPLDLSSLALVSLIEDLEQTFGFTASVRDLHPENFATLASIVAYVERRRSGR